MKIKGLGYIAKPFGPMLLHQADSQCK